MKKPKIILWDLETTGLKGDIGFLLCMGWKVLGERKVRMETIWEDDLQFGEDSQLAKRCADVLGEADVWVTFNGRRFDVKFLNTRLLAAGFDPLPPVAHVDVYEIPRHKLLLHSNRLVSVSEFLGTADEKTPVKLQTWLRAGRGDKAAMKYIIDHCIQDVKVLEQSYLKLRPLLTQHPRMVPFGVGCRSCGSYLLQRRGFMLTKLKFKKQRYQCQACGGWQTEVLSEAERKQEIAKSLQAQSRRGTSQ